MPERQMFGFMAESTIIKKENLVKSDSYTAEYDAYTQDNIPVQIKTVKNRQAICMGDLKKNFTKDHKFILYILNYFSNSDKVKLYKITIDDIKKYTDLFYFDQYEEFWEEFKQMPHGREYDTQWKALRLKYQRLYKSTPRIVNMNPKRDHKIQKRIQCSIPKKHFEEFLRLFDYELIDMENINEII